MEDKNIKDKIDTYQEVYDLAGEPGMNIWDLRSIILERIEEVQYVEKEEN